MRRAIRIGLVGDYSSQVVELEGHPFFIATLFQPELSALAGHLHPLILAFVKAGLAAAT
jgi:CTP synthase (UTP-ammonia lyase)